MRVSYRHWSAKIGAVFFIQERRTKMEKRDKKMPYEVVIQERKRVDLGCIIRKNTKELRESLMSLRYRWLVKEKGANCIVTNPEILKYMELREKSVEAWKDEGWIDCGANDDMFLAIAALANNTDLGQWLIVTDATGDRWVECEEPRFRGDAGCITWRKATVDEIIEHFKNR